MRLTSPPLRVEKPRVSVFDAASCSVREGHRDSARGGALGGRVHRYLETLLADTYLGPWPARRPRLVLRQQPREIDVPLRPRDGERRRAIVHRLRDVRAALQ